MGFVGRGALFALAVTCTECFVPPMGFARAQRASFPAHAVVDASGSSLMSPGELSRAGMALFREGRVQESAAAFDKVRKRVSFI
jgi:hypothetical protein